MQFKSQRNFVRGVQPLLVDDRCEVERSLRHHEPAGSHIGQISSPNTNRLCPYPLAERDSLLRRDRATRSRVFLRLRSHFNTARLV